MDKLPYRQGVYAYILNNDNCILLVHKKNSNMWDFPGGGVDEDESFENAVNRELLEELGTTKFEILHEGSKTYKYDWPKSEIDKNLKKTGTLMRGQEQHHFILKFKGKDSEFALQDEELSKFKWVPLSDIESYMAYPDLFNHVSDVFKEFGINI